MKEIDPKFDKSPKHTKKRSHTKSLYSVENEENIMKCCANTTSSLTQRNEATQDRFGGFEKNKETNKT